MKKIRKEAICQKCTKPSQYDDTYDSYYCQFCVIWLTPLCGDEACDFCFLRPDKPDIHK